MKIKCIYILSIIILSIIMIYNCSIYDKLDDNCNSSSSSSSKSSISSNNFITWSKTYGDNSFDDTSCIIQTSDGGYAFAGALDGCGNQSKQKGRVVKLNQSGDVIWQYIYPTTSTGTSLFTLIQDSDGNYIVSGYELHDTSSNPLGQAFIIKIDSNGNQVWAKNYGPIVEWGQCLYSIAETLDGNYIAAGYDASNGCDFWVLKIDKTGSIIWDRKYGGIGEDGAYSIIPTADNCYAISGYTINNAGIRAWWIIKIDNAGVLLWSKTFSAINYKWNIGAYSIIQTSDGGYAAAGVTAIYGWSWYMVKLDASGDMQWDKIISSRGTDSGCNFAYQIIQTKDNGYAIIGDTDKRGPSYGYDRDIWIVKLDADGNTSWDRVFGESNNDKYSYGTSIIQTKDNGFIAAGLTSCYGNGYYDAWILKLDESGLLH